MSADTIISVSLPRSGHHMLVELLREVFGKSFTYCEFYGPEKCCRMMPCSLGVTLQKTHDFELTLPRTQRRRYLVEYRNFVSSTISAYKMWIENPKIGAHDSRELFNIYAIYRLDYFRKLMWKWARDPGPNMHLVCYEDFLADPVTRLQEIVAFIGLPVRRAVAEVVAEAQITEKNSDHDFKYYDPEFFAFLENILAPDYAEFGISRRYDPEYFRLEVPFYFSKLAPLIEELGAARSDRAVALAERDAQIAALTAEAARLGAECEALKSEIAAARAEVAQQSGAAAWSQRAFRRPHRALLDNLRYKALKSLSKSRYLSEKRRARLQEKAARLRPF